MSPHRAPLAIVVLGAGAAGVAVVRTLRDRGYDGRLVLVSEGYTLDAEPPELYRRAGIDLLLGTRPIALDPARRTVELSGHGPLRYGRLVLAGGMTPLGGATAVAHEVRLATAAGLDVAQAIVVDAAGHTSAPDIWAIGGVVRSATGARRDADVVARGVAVAMSLRG